MGLGAEFVPQLQDRVGKRVVQWGCVGAQPNPAEPSGSSRRANLPPRLPWHRLEPCSLSISEGSTETSRLPKTGHLGIEAVQAGRAAVAAQSSKGTCSAEYIITLLSSSCLPGERVPERKEEEGECLATEGEGLFWGGGLACGLI